MTQVIKLDPKNPDIKIINEAAKIIQKGGLVAFPTETVYGLGADALNPLAVKKIFEAKGRPSDNPFIVHIAFKDDLKKIVKNIPQEAEKLIEKFWPGPLTLILEKSKIIPNEVTSGLDTVAVRMPKNNIAYALISQSKTPIAAPSANLSGKPSPTAARHVFEDLNQKIDLILDGGKTKVGLESTVLDLTSEIPTILRPGKVTFEQIKKVIGNVNLSEAILSKKEIIESVKSPGMKYKHYSPKADLILIKGSTEKVRKKIEEIVLKNKSKKIGILTQDKNFKIKNCIIKFAGKNHLEISNRLFSNLRFFDSKKVDLILVESVNEKGLGLAIMNRLIRAAYKITNV